MAVYTPPRKMSKEEIKQFDYIMHPYASIPKWGHLPFCRNK